MTGQLSIISLSILSIWFFSSHGKADTVSPWQYQTFKSATYQPPNMTIEKHGRTEPGFLFFDQTWAGTVDYAPLIMTDENELVWQGSMPAEDNTIFGLRPQTFEGKPVLTYWRGTGYGDPLGFGYGVIYLLDQSYEEIYRVTLEDSSFAVVENLTIPSWIDLHESKLTDRGSILVTAVNMTQYDLRSVGGEEDGWIADSLFYELDVKTSRVLYRWSALEHVDEIPLEGSLLPIDGLGNNRTYAWGAFHINSVDFFDDGAYLISSRYYCSIYRINRNGTVDWVLNGRSGGDFKLGPGVDFCYQHDARIRHTSEDAVIISMFNNANSPVENGTSPSTGLLLRLDLNTHEATLERKLLDSRDVIYSESQGNYQHLPGGHTLLGHGQIPKFKEYDANGSCVMTLQFGENNEVSSYRGFRLPWIGKPKMPPSVWACSSGNSTHIYMSWNGATELTGWNVYGGSNASHLQLVGSVPKKGFETTIVIGSVRYVQVEGKEGALMSRTSSVVPVNATC
ncbi:hypothetical protein DTO271D3_4654 [Paecilomyces variotii]|nr:hypothetical protein DTO271D3_4654 [Paecilomyces variotii]